MKALLRSASLGLALILSLAAQPASAERLEVRIDISDQEMLVSRDGKPLYRWAVSTARKGKYTPRGAWHPQFLKRMHYSSLYNNAPMPFSIFFTGNYAIHGTNQTARLGRPASAGCVRLHPDHAQILYDLVRQTGYSETLIRIRN